LNPASVFGLERLRSHSVYLRHDPASTLATSRKAAMMSGAEPSSLTRVWIPIGAALFIVALVGSAAVVPQLRLLHSLQALIYVAVIVLAWRDSPWGLGAGLAIALVWNGLQILVTRNFQTGVALSWSFLHTGQLRQVDTMMVAVGTIGHFILIIGCATAVVRQKFNNRKWWMFVAGAIACLVYFALIVTMALPR
jgi:hypothetical protein